MKKSFRPWQVDQSLLLPPSVHDFVPADHQAHFGSTSPAIADRRPGAGLAPYQRSSSFIAREGSEAA
jgi:hypothetical protein